VLKAIFKLNTMSIDNQKLILTPNGYKAGKNYSIKPTDGSGDFTMSRSTSKTRVNKDKVIESVGNNVLPADYSNADCPVLAIEPQRTNLFVNSDSLSNQGVGTNASTYTVSFYGTGTINFSGAFVGTINGTSANERVSLTFSASNGTLNCAVSGLVNNAQLEQGSTPTSYISTTGSTVTRNQDILTNDLTSTIDASYSALIKVESKNSRLKIEDADTGFDLPLNGTGNIAMVVDNQITFHFPDNGQANTTVTYEKPADLRNWEILSKLGRTGLAILSIENGVISQSKIDDWVSGTISSDWLQDYSTQTDFVSEFRQQDWDYFPAIDLSSGADFSFAWRDNNLTSFPAIDLSSGTNFRGAWFNNNLTSFPAIDLSNGTNFQSAWYENNLTSFPAIDLSNGGNFNSAWFNNNLTSFPAIDLSNGTNFKFAWGDNQLTSFPANTFDSLVSPQNDCFENTWDGNQIDGQGVENILVSIDTSGANAPANGVTIDIDTNGDPLNTATQNAITSLKSKGWDVVIDTVSQ